jgi:AcrR family transcriptional regulator
MPRTREQYAKMRDASDQKIRSAALRLFVNKGFSPTSIDDIAESAGVSKGLVYRHYDSKEMLFSSLIEAAVEGNKQITKSMEQEGNPREIIEGITSDIHEHMASGEDFLNHMLLITQGLMSKTLPDCTTLIELDIKAIEAGAKLIRRGQEMGVFGAGNPKEMIIFFFSCIQGLVMLKGALGEYFQMPDKDTMTAFLYEGTAK